MIPLRHRQDGFSLLELIIVMGLFLIIIFAASQMFVSVLSDFKQQGKLAVTSIEGALGLEMLRRDIQHAGFGLFWTWNNSFPVTYQEVAATASAAGASLNDAPNNVPRAIVIGTGANGGLNGSDRLAIKSVNVAANNESEKWTYYYTSPTPTTFTWDDSKMVIGANEYVIVVTPKVEPKRLLWTVASSTPPVWYNQYSDVLDFEPDTTSLVFSIGTDSVPKMPFNRADYYIASYDTKPASCAQGTGKLVKAVVSHSTEGFAPNPLAVLDCVADMQAMYRWDDDNDGDFDAHGQSGPATAIEAHKIAEVRVYILAQEGQKDRNYTYPSAVVHVGETSAQNKLFDSGRDFQMNTITEWQRYRWKLYTLVVTPWNLKYYGTPE